MMKQQLIYALEDLKEKREVAWKKMQQYHPGALSHYYEGQVEAYEECLEVLKRLAQPPQQAPEGPNPVMVIPDSQEIRAGITT